MAYDAILTAMCVVLGLVSLDFGNLKITFEDLPILLGAALFGPWDGMIIGVLGTSIYQMLRFGADPTLPLWVIPLMIRTGRSSPWSSLRKSSSKWTASAEGTGLS